MMHAEIEKHVCDKFIKSREEDTKLFLLKHFRVNTVLGQEGQLEELERRISTTKGK